MTVLDCERLVRELIHLLQQRPSKHTRDVSLCLIRLRLTGLAAAQKWIDGGTIRGKSETSRSKNYPAETMTVIGWWSIRPRENTQWLNIENFTAFLVPEAGGLIGKALL